MYFSKIPYCALLCNFVDFLVPYCLEFHASDARFRTIQLNSFVNSLSLYCGLPWREDKKKVQSFSYIVEVHCTAGGLQLMGMLAM